MRKSSWGYSVDIIPNLYKLNRYSVALEFLKSVDIVKRSELKAS